MGNGSTTTGVFAATMNRTACLTNLTNSFLTEVAQTMAKTAHEAASSNEGLSSVAMIAGITAIGANVALTIIGRGGGKSKDKSSDFGSKFESRFSAACLVRRLEYGRWYSRRVYGRDGRRFGKDRRL